MKEAQIHSKQALVADNQSAKIAQPGEGPLDFPPMLISLLDFGRRCFAFPVSAVRDQEANPPASQAGSQFVRVISLIADKTLGAGSGATTTLPGHFYRGQSPPASFTSAGDAEAMVPPRGTPWPSTTTIHFEPFPRLVGPTQSPPFSPVQSWRQ